MRDGLDPSSMKVNKTAGMSLFVSSHFLGAKILKQECQRLHDIKHNY